MWCATFKVVLKQALEPLNSYGFENRVENDICLPAPGMPFSHSILVFSSELLSHFMKVLSVESQPPVSWQRRLRRRYRFYHICTAAEMFWCGGILDDEPPLSVPWNLPMYPSETCILVKCAPGVSLSSSVGWVAQYDVQPPKYVRMLWPQAIKDMHPVYNDDQQ